MSVSNAPSITFSGLASGLDVSGIVQKMTQFAQQPITLLQAKEAQDNNALTAWQSVNTQLAALQSAAATLAHGSTFTAATGTSSNSAVATITTLPGATLGDHTLTVSQLAQATKIISDPQTSGNVALGRAGSFTLNGKTIAISATDTLTDLSVKINASGAGASAAVINVGPNDYRLTLTGTTTGAANALSAADGSGGVLSSLGLLAAGAATPRDVWTPSAGGYGIGSLELSSATQPVGTLLGAASGTAPSSSAIQINGVAVSLNLNTDSLNAIASKINQANTGVTAQVVTIPDANGNTGVGGKQQLQLVGNGSPPTFADDQNVLGTLGIVQAGFGHTISAAQDAKFNMDGVDITRASNVLGDVLPGATVKLLSPSASVPPVAPATTPTLSPTTLSVAQNTDTVVQAVQSFAAAYNAVQDFITAQNTYTPPTSATGAAVDNTTTPLFGDTSLTQIQDELSNALTAVSGNTTLGSIGVTLDQNNHLQVDTGVLTSAVQANPQQVANLFSLSGVSDSSSVQFVGATVKTQATTNVGYAVHITQAATQASATSGTANTGPSAAPETLTFGGTLFTGGASITLAAGSSLSDMVNQINSNSSLNGKVYATVAQNGGQSYLALSSTQYGASTDFTIASDAAASGTNSGLGSSPISVASGVPVAGTINGEPAMGNGRTLTGNSGNAHTEGLSLLVTATAPGDFGHVAVTHGVADGLGNLLTQIMDPGNGAIIGAENSLNSQISDTQHQVQQVQDQVSAYTDYLNQTFAAMETRISALQAQGGAFAAQVGSASSSSSSSSKL